ncbi:MAG: hypothetical protein JWO86_221 [Myxococcaceae bacterium]|nr:hypothetical protein [Myxococcaceae bacterium]MEA2753553.1 hypothetical protein [Myxococcales bacterium]
MRPPSRRLFATLATLGALAAGCDPGKQRRPVEMAPIGTVPIATRTATEPEGGTTTTPNSGTPNPMKESACAGDDFEVLDEALKQCDTKMPRTTDVPTGMRDKLELRVTSGTPSVAAGGRVDLTITFKNKSSEPLPLYFTGDPLPKFDVEAVDLKGHRVDLPAGKPPKTPALPTRDVKASRITLAPGGTARVKIAWDAVKTRWAPEKVKSWDGRGYPRAPAGPLAAGKYTLRIVVPLVGVFEKGEIELPKVPLDITAT